MRVELLRVNRDVCRLRVWWIVGSWMAYTIAGEKMPWLLTHMALPMGVVGGWCSVAINRLTARLCDVRGDMAHRSDAGSALSCLHTLANGSISGPDAGGHRGDDAVDSRRACLRGLVYVAVRLAQQVGRRQTAILASMGVVVPLFLLTIRFTYLLNYVISTWRPSTWFMRTDRPIKRALREIDLISERTAGERNVVVAYDDEAPGP